MTDNLMDDAKRIMREHELGLPRASNNRARALSRPMSAIQLEQVSWLSPGLIPFGKLTVLEGNPGLGKSALLLDLAARLTRGEGLPGDPAVEAADVILLTAEDGLGDTVKPRLMAANANCDRVRIMEAYERPDGTTAEVIFGDPDDPASLEALEDLIVKRQARLLIIDVLTAYLSGTRDSYRDQDMRAVLRGLSGIAERTGCAIVVVRHLRKASGGRAITAGGGSIAIGGAARSVLLVDSDPEDLSRRILASVKCNLASAPQSRAFEVIGDATNVARINWLGYSDQTAESLTEARASDPVGVEQRTKEAECAECLAGWLEGEGLSRQEVLDLGKHAGFSVRTVERARTLLGAAHKSDGFGKKKRSIWSLPSVLPSRTNPASPEKAAVIGKIDEAGRNAPADGSPIVNAITPPVSNGSSE